MFPKNSGVRQAEIISIGNEVVSGLIIDSNSAHISQSLMSVGIAVSRIVAIGDEDGTIEDAVKQAFTRVDLVVVTGGLGSTHDDITKKVLARVFQSGFRHDEKVHRMLQAMFKIRGREVPEMLMEQCQVPEKAEILYNKKGTAPGFHFSTDGKHLYSLPGVPLEMKYLLDKFVLPQLAPLAGKKVAHRVIKLTGIMESGLWGKIGSVEPLEKLVSVASLPSHLGVNIRLSAVGEENDELQQRLDQAEQMIRDKVEEYIYARDDETLEENVGQLLRTTGLKLAVAESCTGGLIGHRLTQVAGSSDYFMEGAVTYSNAAKENRLGVPRELLIQHGAVSREVALAMARGIREKAGTDIGLAVTGISGPGGGSDDKPVGLTFIAVDDANGAECERFVFHQDRIRNKERAAQAALNLLRLRLKNL
jgi:nicotinamide-nucleotide amidase